MPREIYVDQCLKVKLQFFSSELRSAFSQDYFLFKKINLVLFDCGGYTKKISSKIINGEI